MTIYRGLVSIPATSGLAKDTIVNNWGLLGSPTYTDFLPALLTALKTFYDAWGTHRSSAYTWTAARLKLYNLEEPAPRAPLTDSALGLSTSVATTTLPQETCLVLSFQGTRVSGTPQARRRGRLYLGPFATVSSDTVLGRPTNGLITSLTGAAAALLATSDSDLTWAWIVIHNAGLPGMSYTEVTDGWVDNSWDTQRRRGSSPTARTTFT